MSDKTENNIRKRMFWDIVHTPDQPIRTINHPQAPKKPPRNHIPMNPASAARNLMTEFEKMEKTESEMDTN